MPDRNKVELESGRIKVEVEGEEDMEELIELASQQMEKQCKEWVKVDREVVSEQADNLITFFGGDHR